MLFTDKFQFWTGTGYTDPRDQTGLVDRQLGSILPSSSINTAPGHLLLVLSSSLLESELSVDPVDLSLSLSLLAAGISAKISNWSQFEAWAGCSFDWIRAVGVTIPVKTLGFSTRIRSPWICDSLSRRRRSPRSGWSSSASSAPTRS